MKLYSCRVRLAGDLRNEVLRTDCTASEIVVLKRIHGSTESGADPVVEVTPTGSVKRTESEERARLAEKYGQFQGKPGAQVIQEILGVPGVPLPQYVDGIDEPGAGLDEVIPDEPIIRRRGRPLRTAEAAAPETIPDEAAEAA